jgi:hypothetical protein
MKTISIIFSILFLTISLVGTSQSKEPAQTNESTYVNLERSILLGPESKTEEITIDVESGAQRFELLVKSTISSGKVTVEIYDHENTKQGNFIVETQANSAKKEMATGNIRKSLFEPENGTWTIKIIPVQANGSINIKSKIEE